MYLEGKGTTKDVNKAKELLNDYYDINIDTYRQYEDGIIFVVNGDNYYTKPQILYPLIAIVGVLFFTMAIRS